MVRTLSTKLRETIASRSPFQPITWQNSPRSLLTIALIQAALAIGLALMIFETRGNSVAPILSAALVLTALCVLTASFSSRPTLDQNEQDDFASAEQLALIKNRLSHELRTPLNAVIGFSEIMHREVLGPVGNERYREYAGHIRQSAEQFQTTTEKALAVTELLAAPPSTKREKFDFSVIAERCGASQSDAPPVMITGDRKKLLEASEHLLCAISMLNATDDCSSRISTGTHDNLQAYLRIELKRNGLAAKTNPDGSAPGLDLTVLLAQLASKAAGGVLVTATPDKESWRATLLMPLAR